jgi:hypothetical protein
VARWLKHTLIWYEPATAFSQVGRTITRFTFSIWPARGCGMLTVCRELWRLQLSGMHRLEHDAISAEAWTDTHPSHAGGRRHHYAAQFRRRACMEMTARHIMAILDFESFEAG